MSALLHPLRQGRGVGKGEENRAEKKIKKVAEKLGG